MAIEIVLPRLGWTMEEGTFVAWQKNDGDVIKPGDVLYTVESDKSLNEVEAFDAGVLRLAANAPVPGAIVPVGAVLAYIVQSDEALPAATPAAPAPPAVAPAQPAPMPPAARAMSAISPRARRIAAELGVDWAGLHGSGRSGRIVERDVRAAAQMPAVSAQPAPPPTLAPVSALRRVTAERVTASARTTAPVTLHSEVDATELVRLREQLKADASSSQRADNAVPSFTDLLAKIAAHALREHPALNTRLENDAVISIADVHIGIAVDTPRGLLVVVLRDVHDKPLRQLAAESRTLIERARTGSAAPADLRGSTFTITNLGMYDIDGFTPIINLPECAILGVGRIVPKQVVVDVAAEKVAIRHMLTLSLTFDHRLVDGAPAARFLQRVKRLIEQPFLWLVQ